MSLTLVGTRGWALPTADEVSKTAAGLLAKQSWREAVEYLEQTLKPYPRAVVPHHQLALAYLHAGDIESAVRQSQYCIEIAPDFEGGYITLSGVLIHLREYEKAQVVLLSLLKRQPNSLLGLYNLGVVGLKTGALADGTRMLSKVVAADPKNLPARYYLALCLAKAGKTDKAVAELERVTAAEPLLLEAGFELGRLYHLGGKSEQARAMLERTLAAARQTDPALAKTVAAKAGALGIKLAGAH